MKRIVLTTLATACLAFTSHAQDAAPQEVARRAIERRAAEAVVWGMSAVNYDLMLQQMLTKTAGKVNQVIYWGRPLDWHNQTLTPNPDTLYFMAFLNTKDVGPIVIEVPPADGGGSMNANIVNFWQEPLEDAGLLGVDKGKGIKFLMLPPDFSGEVPAGYAALRPGTHASYGLFRSNLPSHADADVAKSVAYGKRVRIYPLSQATDPPATQFADVGDTIFDSTIRYDERFFEGLNRIVQAEPWFGRDRAMIDQLRSIGIEKGKAFAPTADTKQALTAGAREARTWLEARYAAGLPPFFEGTHWSFPAPPELVRAAQADFAEPDHYPVDARGLAYSYAYIGFKRLGTGQFYLINIRDKDGNSYEGGSTYRLTVPPNAPVEQYWSVTAYDRQTHALIKNVTRASRASNNAEVQKNPDGSVDLYLGPQAPAGKEANWIPTDPAGQFELMFRLYAPTKALFDKAWTLPDVEKMASTEPSRSLQDAAPSGPQGSTTPVTPDNFARAESDLYFGNIVKDGGLGKFVHRREPAAIDNQTVIRLNRDTLYSAAVFDLGAGPTTITLPDAGGRFMSMQVIDEDQYTLPATYEPGPHTLTMDKIGTRYVVVAVRTLVDPADPADLAKVHDLQNAIKVAQPGGPGKFEVPTWDPVSQKKVRAALLSLATTVTDTNRAFGMKDQVDPVQRLIGAASAWGANPPKDATYLNVVPDRNDGKTVYRLVVKDVPVDGFWSVSLYNEQGFFEKNELGAYALNSITSKKSADGSVDIQFGGCDGKIPNCLPTPPKWNYMVRLYRPREPILSGSWKFPEALPVN